MQTFVTILAGVMVYSIGQCLLHFMLEPIKNFKKELGDASFLLLKMRAQIANSSNKDPEAQEELKDVAAQLMANMRQIPYYSSVARIAGLPPRRDVVDACREIIGIGNGVGPIGPADRPAENLKSAALIARLLRISTSYD